MVHKYYYKVELELSGKNVDTVHDRVLLAKVLVLLHQKFPAGDASRQTDQAGAQRYCPKQLG